ncbi:unnamed protein product [Toxocara canis]|uniref:F-box protein n=1 Tax=Toxocara canis TaxID=6265 RepID=A0A183VE48_TOXCA|nr:unnamed protein product [Toxocara canis]
MIDGKRLHDARAFCACGECEIIDGIPLSYAYCCKEAMDVGSACSVAASNLTNEIGSLSCVTKHSSFYSVCLDTEVLNMLSSHEGVCAQWPGVEESLTSRDYRYIAYRAFSYWTHGDDCRGNTLEPPLCVLHRIIQKFPMEDDSSLEQKGLLNVFGIGFYNEYEDQD